MNRDRVLILRTDRMGDVMMALPSVEYVRTALPRAEIDFLVQDIYVDVVAPYFQTRDVRVIGYHPTRNPFTGKKYSAALVLYADGKTVWRAWWAQVPKRIGMYSKLWSFILLSDGLRQERSKAEKNEALYNLDLAKLFVARVSGVKSEVFLPPISLTSDERSNRKARYRLEDVGIDPDASFVLLHPGMGGSALNLSPDTYLKIISNLERAGHRVVLSIGPVVRDQQLARTVLEKRPDLKVVRNVDLSVLREVFRLAKAVIAPSTGPLHLAHYVGTHTVGLYPPVLSQRRERWSPFGGSGTARTVAPTHACPGKQDCIGTQCQQYFCMDQFHWESAVTNCL